MKTAEEIVRALAASEPPLSDGQCVHCSRLVFGDRPHEHAADCPYRMAREWVEGQEKVAHGLIRITGFKKDHGRRPIQAYGIHAGSVPDPRLDVHSLIDETSKREYRVSQARFERAWGGMQARRGAVCKGSWSIGNNCKICAKCFATKAEGT